MQSAPIRVEIRGERRDVRACGFMRCKWDKYFIDASFYLIRRHRQMGSCKIGARGGSIMALPADKKSIQDIFESLKVVRKGTEDDFEIRSSADEKVWGVKMWDEPTRP